MSVNRVYVGGTFDLFHAGHVKLLAKAARYGDVIVCLNTDAFAERYKRLPIMTIQERTDVVSGCKHVKYVDVNIGCEDSTPSLRYWRPQYIAHGDDWTGEALMTQMGIDQHYLDDQGMEMLYLQYTQGISSTQIEERIVQRYWAADV